MRGLLVGCAVLMVLTPGASLASTPPDASGQQDSSEDPKEEPSGPKADDDSGAPDVASEELFERLRPTVVAIETAAANQDPDFYSARIDWASGGLNIYRKGGSGKLDAVYQSIVPDGISLKVLSSPVSMEEEEKLKEIFRSSFYELQERGVLLLRFNVDHPGEEFSVEYQGESELTKGSFPSLSEFTDDQVTIRRGEDVITLSRLSDTSPFYGGSRLHLPNDKKCSSGFPVRKSDDTTWMTTAWHCNKSYDNRFWTPAVFMGYATLHAETIDQSVIDVTNSGRRTAPYIFTGGYPDQSQTKRVLGVSDATNDLPVCVSGSFSYAKCSLYVSQVDEWPVATYYGGPSYLAHGVRIDTVSGRAWVVTEGDSGGPVYAHLNNDTAASAVGIVSATRGQWKADCPARLIDGSQPPRFCAYNFLAGTAKESAIHFGLQYAW